jgi:beta-1,4-mannosyl-glycoprotein beta-1,4-N-acetylglucosaminyltransferase
MLWARSDGEVVSMAMGEFSTLNKPIICKNIGYSGHVHLLKDKAIWYEEKDDLIDILENFDKDEMAKRDWNAYKEYTPEKVMKIFDEVFLDGKNNEETHSPPRSKRKIIDTFIFYNELTMLQFRLKELNDHVDYFVIVEATKTHAGHSKPLFFKENIDRFHAYKDKIIHVVVDDFPASAKEVMAAIDTDKINTHYDAKRPVTSPAWKNENHQRRAGIRRGLEKLKDVLNDEDIILISDADEIPKVDTLDALRQNGLPSDDNLCHLLQNMYYYNLKYKTTRTELGIVDGHWAFAKAIYYSVFVNRHNSDAQEIRMTYVCNGDGTCGFDGPAEKHDPHMIGEHIHDAGWHFSYFGNVQFIKNKLKNFAHQEYNNEEVLDDDRLYDCIEKGNDLFGRVGRDSLIIIKIEDNIENLPHNYKMLL